MDRFVLVVGALLIAGAVAALLGRRTDPPSSNTHDLPGQLDRADFVRPEAPWLVAVFTAASCITCAAVFERARHLESDDVAVQELEVSRAKAIHQRYRIGAVPMVAIANASGEVKKTFLGPLTTAELWAAVAAVRD